MDMSITPIKIITPDTRWWIPDFAALRKSRELFAMLVRRQFLARYQQSVLGVLWVILNPLGQLFIFWLLFGKLLKVPSNDYPYVVFAFAGVVFWGIFSGACMSVLTSLQEQMGIVSKVYFPRILLPIVSLSRVGIDGLISISMLMALNTLYGFFPSWRIVFLPVLYLVTLGCGLAVGLIFAGPSVRFRDLSVPLAYAVQLAMYVTPVAYPPTIVPVSLAWVMELNPMYWVIAFARWIFLGQPVVMTVYGYVSACAVVMLLIAGWLVFAWTERSIVDVQ
jgi:lipopolysaccharide transport system permease protein